MAVASRSGLVLRFVLTLILLAGCGAAGYLAWHHDNRLYGDAGASLANCSVTETVNCDQVNTSAYSALLGVPIAAFAIPTYLLVAFLVWKKDADGRPLAYAFCIGVLATLLSAYLFYVSKTQIGFVCTWCIRLYAVNLAIPILTSWIARRSPFRLVGATLRDLVRWPRPLRLTAGFFACALVLTVGAERTYRDWLKESRAREIRRILSEGGPTVPAVPENVEGAPDGGRSPADPDPEGQAPPPGSSGATSHDGANRLERRAPAALATILPAGLFAAAPAPPAASDAAPAGPYRFAGPVRRVSAAKTGMTAAPFDLQSKTGKGKAVALIFWAPAFRESQRALVEWSASLSARPEYEVYAVAGRRPDQTDDEIWEAFAMLPLPMGLTLLIDDDFKLSKGLETLDVPDVALFDKKGALVIAKLKAQKQMVVLPTGNKPGAEIVASVGAGADVPVIRRMFPYYPAEELYGRCAPRFTAKKFNTNETYTFSGASTSGKPTLLVFWSSTCKHCQIEIPNLVAWLKAHPNELNVVSVTYIKADREGEASHRKVTEAYIKSQGITWPVLEDPDRAIEELYRSISTPTAYFITPDGTVTNAWFYAHEQGFEQALAAELTRANKASDATCRAADAAPVAKMDFQVTGPDGKRVALASLIDKPTVVHFWATWCKPCADELPSLLRFRDTVEKAQTGRVLLVSVEDEAAGPAIEAFQKKMGADLRSYRAPKGGLADLVDLSYRVPRSYVVDPGGSVVAVRQGSWTWDDPRTIAKVQSRFANAAPASKAQAPAAASKPAAASAPARPAR